jgi:nucleotide-binding universal stress UspA family protein
MSAIIKSGWSKPSNILFASECSPNEKALAFALAEAAAFNAELIVLHACDCEDRDGPADLTHRGHSDATAHQHPLESVVQRAADIGVHCKVVVRRGVAADQILAFLRHRRVDRVVMGTHSPGPVGKLLVGSVAEAVLRKATVPVCVVGPNVIEGTFRNPVTKKILCDVSKPHAKEMVVNFAAKLAAERNAGLILQQVIPPQERSLVLANSSIQKIEAELPTLVPARLRSKVSLLTRVTLGDPIEELLYQSRSQQANLIVLGAQGASRFAAVTHAAPVYKVLAYAPCPVIAVSPLVLGKFEAQRETLCSSVNYIAGVI